MASRPTLAAGDARVSFGGGAPALNDQPAQADSIRVVRRYADGGGGGGDGHKAVDASVDVQGPVAGRVEHDDVPAAGDGVVRGLEVAFRAAAAAVVGVLAGAGDKDFGKLGVQRRS
ncbi:MAG: hypothetical protein JO295_04515 [Verrucomicrobia bacterium]|nr:hypothetical protein [Verrucomicrobiota bacterium]